jgi:hypothetical protein
LAFISGYYCGNRRRDFPTGSQIVHNCLLLTRWDKDTPHDICKIGRS